MRAISGKIFDKWTVGGPFIGSEGKPHTRVTVQIGWTLGEFNAQVGSFKKPPLRWTQRAAQDQVETEIPNIVSVSTERSIDQDAATITITMVNQQQNTIGVPNINASEYGNPGYYTFSRGDSAAATTLWGHTANSWNDVLVPNALIRTYQGYGGTSKTIAQAVSDGNIIQTGIWLLDEVKPATGGRLELAGRDLAKLLIDQPLYPPMVPMYDVNGCDVYPLRYSRVIPVKGSQTQAIYYGSGGVAGNTGKKIRGIEHAVSTSTCRPEMEGYWLSGDDGGVFSYGYLDFYGSLTNAALPHPIVGMTATKSNNGYWLVAADGGVYCFGDAQYYGSVPGNNINVTDIVSIERSQLGNGYLIAGANGGVYTYGDATFHGSGVGIITGSVVGFTMQRNGIGSGYWLCTNTGHVYTFGTGVSHHGNLTGHTDVVGMAASATGYGYYLLRSNGAIYAYGDSPYLGSPAQSGITLNDPATDMAVHPDGLGYWIVAEDGGVFTYGNGLPFYGSLPGPWINQSQVDGNYFDITDVIKDLCRWAGLWLDDGGIDPTPHGTFESTGIVSNDEDGSLPEDLFDKVPPIDAINQLKAIVGYQFHIDETGGASFTSPNWWEPGNYLPNGSHTAYIPEINEAVNLTDYGVLYGDRSMRSKIIIASYQPMDDIPGTVITDYTSVNAGSLRGLLKPFMWVNKIFIKPEEQQVMAELIDLHINMRRRLGSVTCSANPLIQLGDQVRIVERETSETYVHYVRSISTTHDLVSGQFEMTLQTNWLGDEDAWAIFIPSVVVHAARITTATSFGALSFSGTSKPAAVATVSTVPAPIIRLTQTVMPTTVATVTAVLSVTPSTPVTISVATIVSPVVIPTPAFEGNAVATPGSLDTIGLILAPEITTAEVVATTVVETVTTLDSVVVINDATFGVSEIITVISIDVPSIEAGSADATTVPAEVVTTATLPDPVVSTSWIVTPSAADTLSGVDAPVVATGVSAAVTTIVTVAAISTPDLSATISVSTLSTVTAMPSVNVTTVAGGFVVNLLLGNS